MVTSYNMHLVLFNDYIDTDQHRRWVRANDTAKDDEIVNISEDLTTVELA